MNGTGLQDGIRAEDGKPKAVHYTEGGPWFKDYIDCEYSELWKQALHNMMNNN